MVTVGYLDYGGESTVPTRWLQPLEMRGDADGDAAPTDVHDVDEEAVHGFEGDEAEAAEAEGPTAAAAREEEEADEEFWTDVDAAAQTGAQDHAPAAAPAYPATIDTSASAEVSGHAGSRKPRSPTTGG
jgi:hypothetical protein